MFSIKIQVLPTDLFHHEQAEDVKISTKADHEKKKIKASHILSCRTSQNT